MAMDKMVEGRLRKYFEEVVLMEQKYVLNDNTNVKVSQQGFVFLDYVTALDCLSLIALGPGVILFRPC